MALEDCTCNLGSKWCKNGEETCMAYEKEMATMIIAFKHSCPQLMSMDRKLIRIGLVAALRTQEKGPN